MSDRNSPSSIKAKYASSGLSWWPVVLFLPARMIFAFLAQGFTAGIFALQGATNPWLAAAAWWPVYSTLTDLFCLGSLVWLTRRESMTLKDLFGLDGKSIWKELAWSPVFLLAVAPGAILANLITQAFYGSALPPMISVVDLPLAGVLYSLIVWPVVWVITEELVYLGYLLPRLEALTGATWWAVPLIILFWGLQHLTMPFLSDGTYLISRVLAATAAIVLFPIVFVVWRRRLLPLIGVHYIADLSTAILAGLLPLLNR